MICSICTATSVGTFNGKNYCLTCLKYRLEETESPEENDELAICDVCGKPYTYCPCRLVVHWDLIDCPRCGKFKEG